MKSSLTIPLAIIAGGIIVALAVYLSFYKPSTATSSADASLVRPVNSQDHILGNPTATVFIVEYADFDCEFCKGFNQTLHEIVANDGASGKVAWVFREFPLTEIHPNALSHARAAECANLAGGNDAFWKFEDALFSNQPTDPSQYGTFARNIGLADNAFTSCFVNASSTVDARIMADRKNALDMGAQGTPFSVIVRDGKTPIVVNGGYSYDALKDLVSQALGQ